MIVEAPSFEHLAAKAEHDHPLGILEREHQASLGEAARLLELVRLDRLGGDACELGDDRLHRFVDPLDVDAALREERFDGGLERHAEIRMSGRPAWPAGARR